MMKCAKRATGYVSNKTTKRTFSDVWRKIRALTGIKNNTDIPIIAEIISCPFGFINNSSEYNSEI